MNKDGLSQNVQRLVSKLDNVKICDTYIEGNWDQNAYLSNLEYDKLDKMYDIISEIERILKINVDEPLDLFSSFTPFFCFLFYKLIL